MNDYLEKIEDYPELLHIDEFVQKHVDREEVWKYFDDDEKLSAETLYKFYLELCEDCDVVPLYSIEELQFELEELHREVLEGYLHEEELANMRRQLP